MTPLAHRLAKQLTIPRKDREDFWQKNTDRLNDALDDIHCFEVTAVVPLIKELTVVDKAGAWPDNYVFCPAPRTWIEWKTPYSGRVALRIHDENNGWAGVLAFWDECAAPLGWISTNDNSQRIAGIPFNAPDAWAHMGPALAANLLSAAHAFLIIINSPKIIGRKQHMPHRGLERALAKAAGSVGRYPLHAWSELTLVATPTYVDTSGIVHEAHLTGRKCLHFCRSHLRVRAGRLEMVSSHWRGDPALGLKRTRYRVVAPKGAA